MAITVLNNVSCSPENAIRKIDNTGRIIIPKGLRDRLNLQEGDEMNFYFLEADGINLIGIGKNDMIDPRYIAAIGVLEELGLEVPPELQEKIK